MFAGLNLQAILCRIMIFFAQISTLNHARALEGVGFFVIGINVVYS